MKKGLFLFLVAIVLLASGCSNSSGKGGTDGDSASQDSQSSNGGAVSETAEGSGAKEEYVIQLLSDPKISQIVTRSDETPVGKVIKDKFNIVFEYIPYSGDYRDKLNMMLAGKDYPELLRIEGQDIAQKYINAGVAVPLDDYLGGMPNFTKRYAEQMKFWRLPSDDGNMYKWESNVPQDINTHCECLDMAVRIDILKEQGYPKLETTSDYLKVLKKAIEDHPTSNGKKTLGVVVPFAESWGITGLPHMMFEKGGRYIDVSNGSPIFNFKDQKFESMLTNEYVKESFKFFNDLYLNGLLDKESFTDTSDQVTEKLNNGQALAVWYTTWLAEGANKNLVNAGNADQQYVALTIKSETQAQRGEKRELKLESTRPFDSYMITNNAKDPKRIAELLDWAASDEGQLLIQSGIENVHYTVENGKRKPTEAFIANSKSDPDYLIKQGLSTIFQALGVTQTIEPASGQPYDLLNDVNLKDELNLTPELKETYKALGWSNSWDGFTRNAEPAPAGLASAVSVDPASEVGTIDAKLIELRVKYAPKLILAESAEEFEKTYDKMIGEYNKLEPQKVIDAYNGLYQENLAKLNK